MVVIKGINKTTLVDYPPYTSSTIFLSGCNFRCPFCHNPDLVEGFHLLDDISEKEILEFLDTRKKWIDAVCITGGEPCIQKDLPQFIKKIKDKGFLLKLDTNGTNPDMIKFLLKNNLIDKIAMDIKSSKENYSDAIGKDSSIYIDKIQKSIDLIKNSGIDYEFRTTVVPDLVRKEDIKEIGLWIGNAKKFAIQNFRYSGKMLDESFKDKKPFFKDELLEMKQSVEKYFDNIEVRE